MGERFIVECVWSGYRASQSKPCHRTVERKSKADEIRKITCVQFTDGTTMSVDVRPARLREKVQEIHGYDSLLSDAVRFGLTGFVTVNQIMAREKAAV